MTAVSSSLISRSALRGTGERVRGRSDESRPFGWECLEARDDAPDGRRISGRCCGLECLVVKVAHVLLLGGGSEDPFEHGGSLRCSDERARSCRPADRWGGGYAPRYRSMCVIEGAIDRRRRTPRSGTVGGRGRRRGRGAGRTLLPGLIDAHAHYTFDPTEGSLQVIAKRTDEVIIAAARGHAALALRAGDHDGSRRRVHPQPGVRAARRDRRRSQAPGPRLVAAGTAVGSVGRSRVGVRARGIGGGRDWRRRRDRSSRPGPTSSRWSRPRRRC